jgi:hypothetical protein
MAELLFITPQEMTDTTIIGGNVDVDKYTMCILNTQLRVVEPLLGSLLYDKVKTDLAANTLAGLYLFMFTEFIKPITKFESCADYVSISPYTLDNSGLYKRSPEGVTVVEQNEVEGLSKRYSTLASSYVMKFAKWIELNPLDEYKIKQDEVNAQTIDLNNGWRFL